MIDILNAVYDYIVYTTPHLIMFEQAGGNLLNISALSNYNMAKTINDIREAREEGK